MPHLSRIACLDLDAFFVEVTLKERPELRGLPLAVGGTSGRGVVCSASYEARPFGIRAGMPMWQALQKCPQLRMLPVSHEVEAFSHRVREELERLCPVVQQASVDEFYLDFTGCDRLYPRNLPLAEWICREIDTRPGLPVTIGIGTNKLIAKVASDLGKPRGICEVFPGEEARFLAPLALKRLPGIGPHLEATLQSMGLQCIGEIPTLPIDTWRAAFGHTGELLYVRAQGLCDAPVIARQGESSQKQISHETTLSEDTGCRATLLAWLSRLLEEAIDDLRHKHLTCGGLCVKLRYADFSTVTRSARVTRTISDIELFPIAAGLFERLFSRRLKVRLIGIKLEALQSGGVTPPLWQVLESERRLALPGVIEQVRDRFGTRAVLRARSIVPARRGSPPRRPS